MFISLAWFSAISFAADSKFAEEFGKRWARTRPLSIAVAEAMPLLQYAFRPDPGSMSFAEQISHLAPDQLRLLLRTQRCTLAAHPSSEDKAAVIKFLADSLDYRSAAIVATTDEQMNRTHSTPGGRLNGRELLLAL